MNNAEMKITHLFHSGFMVETIDKLLIFDYLKSPYMDMEKEILLHSKKDVFVFVTHSHGDHYNPEIFKWEKSTSNISYVLSKDIDIHQKKNYYIMDKYESIKLGDISFESYGTTDRGTSFLVKTNGFTIFHGGDLNWWKWKKDSPQVQLKEEIDFKREIDRLIGNDIDIAFIPVDPRLEEYYYLAGEFVAKTLKPGLLIPMHFSDNYYICKDFKEKIKNANTAVAIIDKTNLSFIYSK